MHTRYIKPFTLKSVTGTNAQNIFNFPVFLAWVQGFNYSSTTAAYVKFYNKTTAPNPASDIPVLVVSLPAGGGTGGIGGVVFSYSNSWSPGIMFDSGLSILITGADSDNDTTPVGGGQIRLNIGYSDGANSNVWV